MGTLLNNGKIIKWLGLVPMKKVKIEVALIKEMHGYQPINYGGISVGTCEKVGTHLTTYQKALENL